MKLLESITADGTYNEGRRTTAATRSTPHATQTVFVWGVFDTATVEIQFSPDGVEWFTPSNGSFTAKGEANIQISAYHVRAVVSSVGVSTSVSMTLI